MKKLYNKVLATGVLASGAVFGGVAMAQESGLDAPDFEAIVGPATDTINSLQPAILAVGGVIITLAAVAMGIRWVKATFF